MTDHLAALLARLDDPPPFALLRRQDGPGVELLLGDIGNVPHLADIPLPEPVLGADGRVPTAQIGAGA